MERTVVACVDGNVDTRHARRVPGYRYGMRARHVSSSAIVLSPLIPSLAVNGDRNPILKHQLREQNDGFKINAGHQKTVSVESVHRESQGLDRVCVENGDNSPHAMLKVFEILLGEAWSSNADHENVVVVKHCGGLRANLATSPDESRRVFDDERLAVVGIDYCLELEGLACRERELKYGVADLCRELVEDSEGVWCGSGDFHGRSQGLQPLLTARSRCVDGSKVEEGGSTFGPAVWCVEIVKVAPRVR